jgi:hypothetical protein
MLRLLWQKRRASLAVYSAFVLPMLAGMTGLGCEYAYALMTQAANQRVADAAAYAGAQIYNSTGSSTSMTSAVSNIAALNGLSSSAVVPDLEASPTGDSNQAVHVTVTTTQNFVLGKMFGGASSRSIVAHSYAELSSGTGSCILANSASGTGITLSGGTSISAPACTVASNNTVTVPCGDTITTISLKYDSTAAPSQPCSGIAAPSGGTLTTTKAATANWLASNSAITTATGHISTVAALTSPSAPTVTANTNDIAFGWTASSTESQATAAGCSATWNSSTSTWTLSCSTGSTFNFRNITLAGGINVNFATANAATNTYNFSGSINNSGSVLTFGSGTFNIAGGLYTGGGTTTTFGSGTFKIGKYATNCSDGGQYSICHTGTTLTFGGPSTFILSAGLYGGSTTVNLGSGTGNTYQFGSSSNGNAIVASGGGKITLADASGSGAFSTVGTVSSSGGSCLSIPTATAHDMNGSFTSSGGVTLGSGVYTFNGYFALGASSGGDVTCGGSAIGLAASSVTLVISGTSTVTCASLAAAFCVGAGFSHVSITAPTTGTSSYLAVIGPTSSSNTAAAVLTAGASNTSVSGVFYFPYGQVSLSGGASLGSGTGQCLELIGSEITLSGGTAVGTTCSGLGGGGSSLVMLVQ